MDDINQDEPWMTIEFFQKILNKSEDDPNATAVGISVKNASVTGDNYLSRMYRVAVQVRSNEREKNEVSLIVKVVPKGDAIEKIFSKSCAFPHEIRMYKETLPKMLSLLESALPAEIYQDFVPKCYLSWSTTPYLLVMEDLSLSGYEIQDRRKGLDLEHCLLVLKTLARFHASSIALHSEDPNYIEVYPDNPLIEESTGDFWRAFIRSSLMPLADLVEEWPDFGESFADNIRLLADSLWFGMRSLSKSNEGPLNVIIHGDLWINNIMFKHDAVTGKPTELKFIDFQLSFKASPAVDLHYFLVSSPTEDVRKEHTYDLLREYHAELCEVMNLLGQGHRLISLQELMDDYERTILWGIFTVMVCLPVILCDPRDACDFERTANTGQDDKGENRLRNESYTKTLKRVLVELRKKGFV